MDDKQMLQLLRDIENLTANLGQLGAINKMLDSMGYKELSRSVLNVRNDETIKLRKMTYKLKELLGIED